MYHLKVIINPKSEKATEISQDRYRFVILSERQRVEGSAS
jgi:hypothetical protein